MLVYTARDHAGNVSTLNRNIQITDADQLSGEVQRVTPALLNGKTAASVQAVNTAKANADAVYSNPHATQLQIDQAKQALATAIANLGLGMLEANTTKTILKIDAPRVLKIRERLIKENNLFRKASFIKISFSNEWFERFFKNSQ